MAKKIWPFDVVPAASRPPLLQAQIKFLEHAHQKGFHPGMDGADFYAESEDERTAWIIRRAARGNVWEIVLSQSNQRAASAYVNDFNIAGGAALGWLSGLDVEHVVEGCREHLTVPPGAKAALHVDVAANLIVKK